MKSDRETSKALMVWEDDGGAVEIIELSGKALKYGFHQHGKVIMGKDKNINKRGSDKPAKSAQQRNKQNEKKDKEENPDVLDS